MLPKLQIAGGSVTGREHAGREGILMGADNQDSFGWRSTDNGIVAIVCDGCSDRKGSGVGARLGMEMLLDTFEDVFGLGKDLDQHSILIELAQAEVVKRLGSLAALIRPRKPVPEVAEEFFLFTVVGLLITEKKTSVFALGDGVYALNGPVQRMGPFPNNAPPYLGFQLYATKPASFSSLDLKVVAEVETEKVDKLMIGTDGCVELMDAAQKDLTTGGKVGEVSQFFDDIYFANSLSVARRLRVINQERYRTRGRDSDGGTQVSVECTGGYLSDDTTLVVIRKEPVVVPPAPVETTGSKLFKGLSSLFDDKEPWWKKPGLRVRPKGASDTPPAAVSVTASVVKATVTVETAASAGEETGKAAKGAESVEKPETAAEGGKAVKTRTKPAGGKAPKGASEEKAPASSQGKTSEAPKGA